MTLYNNIQTKHLDFCDHKLIKDVDWTKYRNYKWTDLNIKAYRQKYVIGEVKN